MVRASGPTINRMRRDGRLPGPRTTRSTRSASSRVTNVSNSNSNSNSSSSSFTRQVRARVSSPPSNTRQIRYNFNRFGNSMAINNNNNLPRMGSPVVANNPTPAKKLREKADRKKMKASLSLKRRLIASGQIPGGRHWDGRRWRNLNKTNVKGFYLSDFTNAGAVKHIKKHKRVYINVDVRNAKVQHVYDRDGIIRLLVNGRYLAKSPLTRRNFTLENVMPY